MVNEWLMDPVTNQETRDLTTKKATDLTTINHGLLIRGWH